MPHSYAVYDLHSTWVAAHNRLIFINPKPHHTAAFFLSLLNSYFSFLPPTLSLSRAGCVYVSLFKFSLFLPPTFTQRCFSCDYCCSASTICSSCLIYEQQYDMPLYYPIKNNRNNTKRANIFALTLCSNGFWAYSLIPFFFSAGFSISIPPHQPPALSPAQHLSRAHFLLFALATCIL